MSGDVLEIRLLGELTVLRGGRVLPLPASRRSRALLSYLVATGRPHLRTQLCELLWESPGDPRAALRWSLTRLRPLVDGPEARRLLADRDKVAFAAGSAVVDLLKLRAEIDPGVRNMDVPALRRAAGLFRGEFLEGLDPQGCLRFYQWRVAEGEALRARHMAVLQALVERLRGEPEDALVYARAWVGADPLSEAAHVAVIEILGALGRPREALRQYEMCRHVLATELAARPSENLERARSAATRGPVEPGQAKPGPAAIAAAAPLVGRSRERATLREWIAQGKRGLGDEVLLLGGDAGIGKTRLLDVLESEVFAAGGRVLRGRAFEAEVVRPYGAWVDALRSAPLGAVGDPLREDLAPLLPELGASAEGDRGRLFDAVVRLLQGLAGAGPLAVVLDDLQWLDEGSVALVHYAARALRATPVLLALAARPGELADNGAALRLLRGLRRERAVREVTVGLLDEAEVVELVRLVAPGVDARRVSAETGGHPLFAVEMARALARGREALSDTLAGLIADRLSRLDEAARDLVPWMAAVGHAFDLDLLAAATEAPSLMILAAVGTLQRHGVLTEVRQGGDVTYDFVHDLVRRSAYLQISGPARRLLHGRLARALQSRPDPDGTLAADVARHAHLAGDHEACVRACLRAGERCLRVFAFAEATALAERGSQHARELPVALGIPLQVALLGLRVHSALAADEGRRVEEALLGRLREAEQAGLTEAAQAALQTLTLVHWYRGDLSGAHLSALRQADLARATEPPIAVRGLAATARCLAHLERDVERAEALLAEARALAPTGEIMDASWAQGLLLRLRGEYVEAVVWLERALLLGRREQDRYCEWDCQARLVMIELERGRPEAALQRCLDLGPLVERLAEGSEPALSAALEALARCALCQGDGPPALERALTALRDLDSKWALAYTQTLAGAQDLAEGRASRARARAEEAWRAAEAVKRRSEAVLARALLARMDLEAGARQEALGHWEAVRADVAAASVISARAREAWEGLLPALGIPTPTTTVATTGRM